MSLNDVLVSCQRNARDNSAACFRRDGILLFRFFAKMLIFCGRGGNTFATVITSSVRAPVMGQISRDKMMPALNGLLGRMPSPLFWTLDLPMWTTSLVRLFLHFLSNSFFEFLLKRTFVISYFSTLIQWGTHHCVKTHW